MTNREMLEMLCRDMGEVKVSVHRLEEDFGTFDRKVEALEKDVDFLKTVRENEISRKIMMITRGYSGQENESEGHEKLVKDMEEILFRLTMLEKEMRIIKNQLGITA